MLRASLKLLLLLVWILLWMGPTWIARKLHNITWRDRFVRLCYLGILRIVGIRLSVSGELARARPLLLITNHLSYLDVMILGAAAPVRFTPKSEVAKWPLISSICRMCDAVFIDRRADKIKEMHDVLAASLASGVVCLFPEGTTGDGRHLLPFKSSFFALAEETIGGSPVTVQCAAIAYTHIRKLPIDITQWPDIAWYGDMYLLPHLFHVLKMGIIDAELVFLPSLPLQDCIDRKQLAGECHRMINDALCEVRNHPHIKRKHIEIKQFFNKFLRQKY